MPRVAAARVRSGGSRVHSPSSSPRFPPATGSLCRRSTGTRPVHSPLFVMSAGGWQAAARASSGLPRSDSARPVRCSRLEPGHRTARAGWIAREARIGRRALAQPERGAAAGRRRCAKCRHVPHRPGAGVEAHGGGEGGIRTHEVFRLSAFQERRHQPLGHLSGGKGSSAGGAVRSRRDPRLDELEEVTGHRGDWREYGAGCTAATFIGPAYGAPRRARSTVAAAPNHKRRTDILRAKLQVEARRTGPARGSAAAEKIPYVFSNQGLGSRLCCCHYSWVPARDRSGFYLGYTAAWASRSS